MLRPKKFEMLNNGDLCANPPDRGDCRDSSKVTMEDWDGNREGLTKPDPGQPKNMAEPNQTQQGAVYF